MKIKNIVGLVISHFFVVMCSAQEFDLKGSFTEFKYPMDVTFEYRGETQTFLTKDGKFEFKGNSMPTGAHLRIMPHSDKYTMQDAEYWQWLSSIHDMGSVRDFFLEGNVTIEGKKSLDDAVVGGAPAQEIYEKYYKDLAAFDRKIDLAQKGAQSKGRKTSSALIKKLKQDKEDFKVKFVQQYPESYFSLDQAKLESQGNAKTLDKMLDTLGGPLKETSLYKTLIVLSRGDKLNKIGNPAQDFTENTVDSEAVTLSSFKGKYVLVDFWASWCVPCRAENPNVLKAYNKYKDKNFDIISVSIDTKKDAWVKAVNDDKLPWTQISDLKPNNAAAAAYGVKAVPSNVLINPEGIIVAKDLRGENLHQTLEKFLK